jgi:hypothetical protein
MKENTMSDPISNDSDLSTHGNQRRAFIKMASTVAVTSLFPKLIGSAVAQTPSTRRPKEASLPTRRLNSLEVSALGLGCSLDLGECFLGHGVSLVFA